MVKQTSIRSAYHKVGDPSTKRGGDCWSRCKSICCFLVVGFLLVSIAGSGGSNRKQPKKNLRPTPGSGGSSPYAGGSSGGSGSSPYTGGSNVYGGGDSYGSTSKYDKVHVELYDAEDRVEVVAYEEAEVEKSRLASAASQLRSSIYNGIANLLKGSVSEDEIEEMTEKVEEELKYEAMDELDEAARDIADDAVDKMDNDEEDNEKVGMTVDMIEQGISDSEKNAVVSIVRDISGKEHKIENEMADSALELEKKILEERLSEKLGRPVEINIKDNMLDITDELLDGLNALKAGGSSTGGNSDPYGYSNSGSGGYNNGSTGGYSGTGTSGGNSDPYGYSIGDSSSGGGNTVGYGSSGARGSSGGYGDGAAGGGGGSDSYGDSDGGSEKSPPENGGDGGDPAATKAPKKKGWFGGGGRA